MANNIPTMDNPPVPQSSFVVISHMRSNQPRSGTDCTDDAETSNVLENMLILKSLAKPCLEYTNSNT